MRGLQLAATVLLVRASENGIEISQFGASQKFWEQLFLRNHEPENFDQKKFKLGDLTINNVFSVAAPATIEEVEDEDDLPIFRGMSADDMKIPVVNNYGCYCFGGPHWPGAIDNQNTGYGKAVDVFDENCKAHKVGFDCITLDSSILEGSSQSSCDPSSTKYDLEVTQLDNGDYVMECVNDDDTEWCQKKTCLVELRFLARNFKLENDGHVPDYEKFGHTGFHGNRGSFDTFPVCLPSVVNRTPIENRRCCGDYPYRVFYDAENQVGDKCCEYEDWGKSLDWGTTLNVGEIYNERNSVCCASGVKEGSRCSGRFIFG